MSLGYNAPDEKHINAFSQGILDHYHRWGRSMPWREDISPYSIFLSEVMLQQTQVSRVTGYYQRFMKYYPDFNSLASADLPDLLLLWKGLGYNRRAKFLRQSAQMIVENYAGRLPSDPDELVRLPGIGPNTAGSIAAFAFNSPVIFIETNIRRVFLHEFFPVEEKISDRQIYPLIERSMDRKRPRIWYWGIMDYGVSLKEQGRAANRRSRHHSIQGAFQGSRRQLRSALLYAMQNSVGQDIRQLNALLRERLPEHPYDEDLLKSLIAKLHDEGFVVAEEGRYRLAK